MKDLIQNSKALIRKNKALTKILKPVYRTVHKGVTYSYRKKLAQQYWNQISNVSNTTQQKRIWFFCIPDHPNLGDQAQRCCIEEWLQANYVGCEILTLPSVAFNFQPDQFVGLLKQKTSPEDLIVFQSGYTMVGRHAHPDEAMRFRILKEFPENKVIIFPNTIRYTVPKEKEEAKHYLNGHPHLTVMTRDRVSYEAAKEMFDGPKILLYPDIVTSKIGAYSFSNPREDILFCMRNDAEQFYEKASIEQLRKNLEPLEKTHLTDTTVNLENLELVPEKIWPEILKVVEEYSKYKLIITDRYHGTIFSLIAGTPVIVLKTTDHKVVTGVDWFKGVYDAYVSLAGSLEEAEQMAKNSLQKEYSHQLDNYFDREYYQKLKQLLEAE